MADLPQPHAVIATDNAGNAARNTRARQIYHHTRRLHRARCARANCPPTECGLSQITHLILPRPVSASIFAPQAVQVIQLARRSFARRNALHNNPSADMRKRRFISTRLRLGGTPESAAVTAILVCKAQSTWCACGRPSHPPIFQAGRQLRHPLAPGQLPSQF